MKTLFSALRRRRGIAAQRRAAVATLRAALFAAAAVGVAGVASADPVPEPPRPSTYAKSQPQKAVAAAIEHDDHRPKWKTDFTDKNGDKFSDYNYEVNTKHQRYRYLYKLSPEEQQRALAQLSGEIYTSLPIARARLENQTYRNLGYLLRPDGVFAGVGVGPVIAAPVGIGAGPVPIGGVGFNASSFGPAYPVPAAAPYGGPVGAPVGGLYGGGFAPGIASDGLNVVGPVGPGYGGPNFGGPNFGGPNFGGPNFGGPNFGGPNFGPTPDPAFGPGVAAGTPVPAGSYLTPDGRLVGPDGQPVRPGRPGVNNGPSGVTNGPVGPVGPVGQPLGVSGVNGGVGPNGMPIGPNGQPIRPNGPNFGAQGVGPQGTGPQGINGLAGPGAGPGLNAPGAAGGLNGAGTPIPAGSTFGPNGEVIAPDGRVLGGGRPVGGPTYGAPIANGPNYGGPANGPNYGGPNYGGPVGGPVYGGPGLIGPGYGGPAYGPGAAPIAPLVGPPVGGFGGGVIAGPALGGPALGGLVGGPPVGGVLGGWVTGYYVDGDLDGTDHRSGVDYDLGGVNFGLARQVSPTLLVGGFVGFGHVNGDSNLYDLGHYDIDTFQFGAYARKLLGNFYVIGAATAGLDEYEVNRNVDYNKGLDRIYRPATANFHGSTASVFGELGYTKAINCSHFIQPFVSLQYTHVRRGGFRESGSFDKNLGNDYYDDVNDKNVGKNFAFEDKDYGSNLTVTGVKDDFLRTRVGARYFRRLRNCAGTFRVLPELRAYWAHEEYDPSSFTARMNDMHDCPFVVAGLRDVNDAAVLGGGLTFAHCCGLSLYGNTDIFLADRDEAIALSGGTQFVW